MIEAIPHHAQNGVARTPSKSRSFGRITVFDCGKHFLDAFWITSEPAAGPPKDALDHDCERNDRHDQNRPHNRPALAKLVDQPVAAKQARFRSGRSSWRGTRSGRRSRTLGTGWCRARHCAWCSGLPYCSGLSRGCRLLRCRLPRGCWLLRCGLPRGCSLPWRNVSSRRLLCRGSRTRACCRRSLCGRRRLRE